MQADACKKRTRSPLTVFAVRRVRDFIAIDFVVALAQAHGWKGEPEFRPPMMMHVNGVRITEARELFADAARRLQ